MVAIGTVRSLKGIVLTVEFFENQPPVDELLYITIEKSQVPLLLHSYKDETIARCINLTDNKKIVKGMKVSASGKPLEIPVGDNAVGHIFNALGLATDVDEQPEAEMRAVNDTGRASAYTTGEAQIMETGIKVLDFFTPFVKGRKIGIIGGAGVGKTVLMMELIHNVGKQDSGLAMFTGIGERVREGHELYETLKERKLLGNTVMYFAQMNENPALRAMVGISSTRLAEYYRDEEKKDILFFVDNIYRYVQARNELSTILDEIPSEGGYQATIFSDIKALQDRLSSNENGSIPSVQTIYVPADDLSDPAVQMISHELDSVVVLSRKIAEQGIRPAVDIIRTKSSLLTPAIVGDRHYQLVERVQILMQKYESLKNIIAIIGENELSPIDRSDYAKAKKLIEFFSQELHVTEDLTGNPGQYATLEETLKGVEEILV